MQVHVIKMNPVAKTFVQKALKRVVDRERRKGSILLSSIEALAESSSGDLRAAVHIQHRFCCYS